MSDTMSDTWDRTHRRYRLVQDVLENIARTGRPAVPAAFTPAVDAEFGGFGGFLRDVRLRWYRAFDARLDALLEDEPDDLEAALARLHRELAAAMPGAAHLLAAHAEHPALRALDRDHRHKLRAATGIRARTA
jgi:hypothetical protein